MDPLTDWLEAHGLARYAEPFAAQDIGLDVLPELTEADLKELGVASLGDRKRLLKARATWLPAHFSISGFCAAIRAYHSAAQP